MNNKFTGLDNFIYYAWCILSLGFPFFMKIIVKKAIMEMEK